MNYINHFDTDLCMFEHFELLERIELLESIDLFESFELFKLFEYSGLFKLLEPFELFELFTEFRTIQTFHTILFTLFLTNSKRSHYSVLITFEPSGRGATKRSNKEEQQREATEKSKGAA